MDWKQPQYIAGCSAEAGNMRAIRKWLNRQKPNSASRRIDGDQSSCFQVRLAGSQGAQNQIADCGWENILRADLNYAWPPCVSASEKRTEVQIVRENYHSICTRVVYDLAVASRSIPKIGPMSAFETGAGQKFHPLRAEIHVDEKLQAKGSGTSISSARQAA